MWKTSQDRLLKSKQKKEKYILKCSGSNDSDRRRKKENKSQILKLLRSFQCTKDKNTTLEDLVYEYEGKETFLSLKSLRKVPVFNTSFYMEDEKEKCLKPKITNEYLLGRSKTKEITVMCNLFNPPKEYNAYICLCSYFSRGNTVMLILSDISDRIDLKTSKISEKMKTVMFCSISHELRSPLNHISGMHTLLKSKLETEEQK